MKTTDGRGLPLEPDALYFVQDTRSIVGNCAMFWAKNGAGYVCALEDAGAYPGHEVANMRETDIPWPMSFVLSIATKHVRASGLHG